MFADVSVDHAAVGVVDVVDLIARDLVDLHLVERTDDRGPGQFHHAVHRIHLTSRE